MYYGNKRRNSGKMSATRRAYIAGVRAGKRSARYSKGRKGKGRNYGRKW